MAVGQRRIGVAVGVGDGVAVEVGVACSRDVGVAGASVARATRSFVGEGGVYCAGVAGAAQAASMRAVMMNV
jgi:hypothetical protein